MCSCTATIIFGSVRKQTQVLLLSNETAQNQAQTNQKEAERISWPQSSSDKRCGRGLLEGQRQGPGQPFLQRPHKLADAREDDFLFNYRESHAWKHGTLSDCLSSAKPRVRRWRASSPQGVHPPTRRSCCLCTAFAFIMFIVLVRAIEVIQIWREKSPWQRNTNVCDTVTVCACECAISFVLRKTLFDFIKLCGTVVKSAWNFQKLLFSVYFIPRNKKEMNLARNLKWGFLDGRVCTWSCSSSVFCERNKPSERENVYQFVKKN